MASISNTIGEHIKEKRVAAGLTLVQAAEISGVAASTISRVETGSKFPTLPTLISLSEALDLDLFELLAKLGGKAKRDLPEFEDYLRQKYDMADETIARVAAYFRKQASTESSDES